MAVSGTPCLSTSLNLAWISASDVPNHQEEHYHRLPGLPQEMLPGQEQGSDEPATGKRHTLSQTLKQSGLDSKAASGLRKPKKTK